MNSTHLIFRFIKLFWRAERCSIHTSPVGGSEESVMRECSCAFVLGTLRNRGIATVNNCCSRSICNVQNGAKHQYVPPICHRCYTDSSFERNKIRFLCVSYCSVFCQSSSDQARWCTKLSSVWTNSNARIGHHLFYVWALRTAAACPVRYTSLLGHRFTPSATGLCTA